VSRGRAAGLLGWIAFQEGAAVDGESLLRAAIVEEPGHWRHHYRLGRLLQAAPKGKAEGQRCLLTAARLAP